MFAFSHLCFVISAITSLTHGVNFPSVDDLVDTNEGAGATKITRLPDAVRPWAYDLAVTPDLNKFKFTGSVIMSIQVFQSTMEILLHSKGLDIHSVELKDFAGGKVDISYTLDVENELMNISMKSQKLPIKSYWAIYVNFTGTLNDDMRGFYRSSYTVGKTTKWLAATQFESTFARMAFPCFDEPGYRSSFKIRVYTEPHQQAMSNMPKLSAIREGSKIRHTFETTPSMPTYLVAFMVSEMVSKSDSAKYGVWARENAIEDASYALDVGPKCLKAMEQFTLISYTLPKMDLVAIPDFDAGAMENWGMITYRESAMLFNKSISSERHLQRVTMVIAHETVHQWFGDLVTPYWWDYLWLNEGFARYFQYKVTATVHPTWRINEFFVVDCLHAVLFEDEATVHHSVTSSVQTPAEIGSIFDIISYGKGAAVLRMLEYMVSPKIFKNALHQYLKHRAKENGLAQPSDLWEAFETFCQESCSLPKGYTISDIMTLWTTLSGYPLVTVSRMPLQSQTNIVLLEQQPYEATYRSASDKVIPKYQSWAIPVSYTTQSNRTFTNTDPMLWLTPKKRVTVVDQYVSPDEWIILNLQQTGYYRVNYDLKNWHLLIQQLIHDPSAIHVLNRAQLIDDSWALAIDNKLPYSVPFALTRYLAKETDVLPWYSAISKFEYVYSLFENTCVKEKLRNFFLEHLNHPYKRLGFHVRDTDDHLTKVLRNTLISLVCRLDSEECVDYAEQLFKEHFSDLSKIPADLKAPAFCAAFNNGNYTEAEVWGKLWGLYSSSNSAHEKETLLLAIGCMRCRGHLKKYMRKLLDPNDHDIRKQDEIFVYRAIFSTPYGTLAAVQLVDALTRNVTRMERNEMKLAVALLKHAKNKITSRDQVAILKKLHTEAEAQKGKICAKYAEAVKVAYELGVKRTDRLYDRHGEIAAILSPSKPSGGYSLTPSISGFWVVLAGGLIYLQAYLIRI